MHVAAIIPVYNGRRFLRGAVETVLAQTRRPDERLIIDDGSSDDALAALDGLSIDLPLKRLRQDNRGQSAAHNLGARETRCELLALRDQDDLLAAAPRRGVWQRDAAAQRQLAPLLRAELAQLAHVGRAEIAEALLPAIEVCSLMPCCRQSSTAGTPLSACRRM
jgi:glycosyltransferase involved in cell wall biosynthesis